MAKVIDGNGDIASADEHLLQRWKINLAAPIFSVIEYTVDINTHNRYNGRMPRRVTDNITLSNGSVYQVPTERWPGFLNTDEHVIDFVRRVWGHILKTGLMPRAVMEKYDSSLLNAIYEYRRDHPLWPDDLRFKGHRNSAAAMLKKFETMGPSQMNEAELISLGGILRRRKSGAPAKKKLRAPSP